MAKVKIFIDSDVIISSLLSKKGASNIIVNNTNLSAVISNFSYEELDRTVDKLGIDRSKPRTHDLTARLDSAKRVGTLDGPDERGVAVRGKLGRLLKNKLKVVKIELNKVEIINRFGDYTNDIKDIHIIAGAKTAKVKFLITFNMKDYKIEKIQQELGIKVINPGEFLQYLRSIE